MFPSARNIRYKMFFEKDRYFNKLLREKLNVMSNIPSAPSMEKSNNIRNATNNINNNNILANYRTSNTTKTTTIIKQSNNINNNNNNPPWADKARRNNSLNPGSKDLGSRLNSLGKKNF